MNTGTRAAAAVRHTYSSAPSDRFASASSRQAWGWGGGRRREEARWGGEGGRSWHSRVPEGPSPGGDKRRHSPPIPAPTQPPPTPWLGDNSLTTGNYWARAHNPQPHLLYLRGTVRQSLRREVRLHRRHVSNTRRHLAAPGGKGGVGGSVWPKQGNVRRRRAPYGATFFSPPYPSRPPRSVCLLNILYIHRVTHTHTHTHIRPTRTRAHLSMTADTQGVGAPAHVSRCVRSSLGGGAGQDDSI